MVPGDAGSYRCEVTAKDKCDSSTFDISVEGECVEKKQNKTTGPWDSVYSVDMMWILMCCFSRYSRATGGADRYSVCLQEGVSTVEVACSVEIRRPRKNASKNNSLKLTFCVTSIVCKLVQKNTKNLHVSR